MQKRHYLSISFLLAAVCLPLQAEIYKSVDEEGNVLYSDKAPNDASVQTSEVKPNTQPNVTDSEEEIAQRQPKWLKDAQQQRAERAEKDKSVAEANAGDKEPDAATAWKAEYKAAKDALKAAKKALKTGVIAEEGDFIGLAGGGVRPTEQYINKQRSLEQAVEDAKKHLKAIKKAKP